MRGATATFESHPNTTNKIYITALLEMLRCRTHMGIVSSLFGKEKDRSIILATNNLKNILYDYHQRHRAMGSVQSFLSANKTHPASVTNFLVLKERRRIHRLVFLRFFERRETRNIMETSETSQLCCISVAADRETMNLATVAFGAPKGALTSRSVILNLKEPERTYHPLMSILQEGRKDTCGFRRGYFDTPYTSRIL
jgi:hypothetical protein